MNKIILRSLLALILVGCDIGGLHGNGNIVTESRSVQPFTSIETSGGFEVDWRSGPPSASLTADENLLSLIDLRVSNGTLTARTTRNVRPTHSIQLHLTSPSLTAASLSGASRFNAHRLSGARFSIETSGASKVELDGTVGELIAGLTGASDLRAESLQTKSAELSLTGAADARVHVTDSLKTSITGAGSVRYSGNPPHVERHITGAGTIRKSE
ncbi:MAG: head GIN domain-containing protein [Chthoniobacterales bacterium]